MFANFFGFYFNLETSPYRSKKSALFYCHLDKFRRVAAYLEAIVLSI
jgi:hypothetical protein